MKKMEPMRNNIPSEKCKRDTNEKLVKISSVASTMNNPEPIRNIQLAIAVRFSIFFSRLIANCVEGRSKRGKRKK
jgi:hypothetical protein